VSFWGFGAVGRSENYSSFFADDSLLYLRAIFMECVTTLKGSWIVILRLRVKVLIFRKSAVCFSKQISAHDKRVLAASLGMTVVEYHQKYLGLPCVTSRNKRILFDDIKERVWNKLQCWSNRFFSGG
jgi:hypothetical protein